MIYKNYLYKICKSTFIKNISFKDKNKLLKAVKSDWNRQTIILNNNTCFDYLNFLEVIKKKYKKYEEIIYTLCNQCVHSYYYHLIFDIIRKYNYHMSNTDCNFKKLTTSIYISSIIKQAIITNYYDIYKIEDEKKIYKIIKVTIVINISGINEDVLLKIGYINYKE